MTVTRAPATFSLRSWLTRMSEHVSLGDVAHVAFLTAPSGAARFAWQRLRGERLDVDALPPRDPEFIDALAEGFRALAQRYFRWRVRGIEHVPEHGAALLVGSHNGGMINTDAYLTHLAIYDRFGTDRVVRALAHDWNFYDPVLRSLTSRAGGLPASHASAHRAFARGELVLVYPGADLDAFRAFRHRHRVELGGRTGFVRLALRARVPIIPLASAGTHEQFVVLTRGDGLARALGLDRILRARVLPIVLAIPWGVTLGFLPYLPLPAQTTIAFGPALAWPDLDASAAEDRAVVARCYDEVRAALQTQMDAIHRARVPWLGEQ